MAKVKIVIVGAGIAGLSTYLFLDKLLNTESSTHEFDIKIYESYDINKLKSMAKSSPSNKHSGNSNGDEALSSVEEPLFTPQAIGSAIGISKNGLNVVSRISPRSASPKSEQVSSNSSLINQMAARGHPITKWAISTARGFDIVDYDLVSANERTVKGRLSSPQDSPHAYQTIMIARQAFWELLRDQVLQLSPDVVVQRKVVDVIIGDEASPNIVKFEGGGEELVDLVIGADGLRSIVRQAMFSKHDDTKETNPSDGQHAIKAIQPHHLTDKAKKGWVRAIRGWFSSPPGEKARSEKRVVDFITPHYEYVFFYSSMAVSQSTNRTKFLGVFANINHLHRGLVGVGGFVPSSVLEAAGHIPGTMTVVFGRNGFFGHGYLTSAPAQTTKGDASGGPPSENITTSLPGPLAGWWSTFSSPTAYPYQVNDGNTETAIVKPTVFDRPLATSALLARHAHWSHPSVKAILSYISDTSGVTDSARSSEAHKLQAIDAVYPTYTTPELPHWSVRGRVVLVGDSAHALQPSSGQGASQALEDAEALGLLLAHQFGGSTNQLAEETVQARLVKALLQYESLRKPRVHEIYLRSQRMSQMKGDMGIVVEWIMYFMIYLMSKLDDIFLLPVFKHLPNTRSSCVVHNLRSPFRGNFIDMLCLSDLTDDISVVSGRLQRKTVQL